VNLRDLWTLNSTLFVPIVKGYALRASVARSVFPHARLGTYGVVVNDCLGDIQNMTCRDMEVDSYQRAGDLGLYDSLDFVSPVLCESTLLFSLFSNEPPASASVP